MSSNTLAAGILYIGHSLVGDLPPMLADALAHGHGPVRVESRQIPGAPLIWHWQRGAESADGGARSALEEGFGVVVMTEAIPLENHLTWSETHGYAAAFHALATEANPKAQVYLYETWHSIDSGSGRPIEHDSQAHLPWRERLELDLPNWQGIVDAVNAQRAEGTPPMRLVPAGQALARLNDAIEAGEVPGLTDIRELFGDDIHPTALGWYFVTMVHFAVILGESPQGLPPRLGRTELPSPEMAAAMQRIAWETVTDLGAAGPLEEAAVAVPAAPGRNVALGLSEVTDYSPAVVFLDVMKTARRWTGHLHGQWGGCGHEDLEARGLLDDNGWLRRVPEEVSAVSALILVDMPEVAQSLAGRYRITWEGVGRLEVRGRAQNVVATGSGVFFDYTPGPGLVELAILQTDPHGTGDYIRNIRVLREEDVASDAAGEIFNPRWLDRLGRPAAVRFMDWMNTNDSRQGAWADRPRIETYTWTYPGVPLEVMIALANRTGAEPWFVIPHRADDAYVRRFAEMVRDELAPDLRAWVEYSNEVWNPQFKQFHWAQDQAAARWGVEHAGAQYYGMRAAEIMRIWADVFADEADNRLVRVLSVQTGWLGLEGDMLQAPLFVAEDPAAHRPPAAYFDGYGVAAYFDGRLGSEEMAPIVLDWIAQSELAARAEGEELGLRGHTLEAFVAQHRYDQAIGTAAKELLDGSVTGDATGSIARLFDVYLAHHAAVAESHGLDLLMYEGGTHVVGLGPLVANEVLTDFFIALNYSGEMGELYAHLLDRWDALAGTPFNVFVEMAPPSRWGSWGALRHLEDSNPRWDAVLRFTPRSRLAQ